MPTADDETDEHVFPVRRPEPILAKSNLPIPRLITRLVSRRHDRRAIPDFGEDFQALHGDVARRLNAQLHLVAFDSDDDNPNVATDHNRLIGFAAEHEHVRLLGGR